MKSQRINYQAAAEYLGIKVGTLRSMVNRKQVPHVKLPSAGVVFDVAALDAWKPELDERLRRTEAIGQSKKGRDLYVAFCSVTRLCKIGRSNDARARLQDLQIGSPTRLILWCHAPGIGNLEHVLHRAFASSRMHGEWFSSDLTARIAECVRQSDSVAFKSFVHQVHRTARRREQVETDLRQWKWKR